MLNWKHWKMHYYWIVICTVLTFTAQTRGLYKYCSVRAQTVRNLMPSWVVFERGFSCHFSSSLTHFVTPWIKTGLHRTSIVFQREARWSHGQSARLRIEWSGFGSWLGTLCCVLGQDTLLSLRRSPPRCINGHRRKCWE